MPDDSIPRSIAIILLILGGGFFAGSETALSYCNRIRMKTLADDGDKAAKRVIKILDKFDNAIIALLIGNNVTHVVASTVATLLALSLVESEALATTLSVAILTVLVFIFSETIPKSIAKANADSFSKIIAIPLICIIFILKPLEIFFSGISNFAKWVFKQFTHDKGEEPSITEDEFTDIIESVEEDGIIKPVESEIIKSAIEFRDALVSDVMLPAAKVTAIDIDAPIDEIKSLLLAQKYSRLPVYSIKSDNIVGILHTRSCLWRIINDRDFNMKSSIVPAFRTSPDKKLDSLFEEMGKNKVMMAVVTDNFGRMLGIITLEDILEEIVGEIYDEDDSDASLLKEVSVN